LKIALVVHDARPGGGQDRYVLELANRLSECHNVTLFSRTATAVEPRVRHIPIVVPGRPLLLVARTFAQRARGILNRGIWDVVHTVGGALPGANVVTAQYCHHASRNAARRWKTGLASPLHRLYRAVEAHQAINDERTAARHTNLRGLIAVSRRTLHEWQEAYRPVAAVQTVVPNGVDRKRFQPGGPTARRELRASLGLPDSARIALLVGALVRKGIETAVAVLSRLPPAVHLVAVGAGPHVRVRALARQAGVGDRLHLEEPVSDVARFFAGSDVFLFPSRYEPFGMVVAEAWATGLPVVASGVTGATEWGTPGENILVVEDPQDVDGFANAANRILDDDVLASKLAEHGRALARTLSWEHVTSDTESVYEQILGK
jgi:glycosyltransferase involved in cell wall biosynthesis